MALFYEVIKSFWKKFKEKFKNRLNLPFSFSSMIFLIPIHSGNKIKQKFMLTIMKNSATTRRITHKECPCGFEAQFPYKDDKGLIMLQVVCTSLANFLFMQINSAEAVKTQKKRTNKSCNRFNLIKVKINLLGERLEKSSRSFHYRRVRYCAN